MVEAEEVGEFLGVVGAPLHGVEQGELLVQQDLAAAGEVDEDLGDTGPQFGLFDRGLDGGALEGVEGLADLAHLVLVVLQLRHLGLHVDLFAGGEAAHHTGQPYAGGSWASTRSWRRSRMRPRPTRTDRTRETIRAISEDDGDDGLTMTSVATGRTRSW